MEQKNAMTLIRQPDRMTIGFELPLDNDWSPVGEARRAADGRSWGVPDLSMMGELVRKADQFGFAAVWVRDVPVFDTVNFGDAGSVHDVFTLLGYLAAITHRIALGTAAVVLPIRHPLMVAKAAASADVLSGGRLILGVASGDRPVEYPLLGLEFETRGQAFRAAVDYLRAAWEPGGLPFDGERVPALDLLPRPLQRRIPMVAAGQAQQSNEWLASHMDGRFTYPMGIEKATRVAQSWNEATEGRGAVLSAFFLDLLDDVNAPMEPIRLGARTGRNALVTHFQALTAAGVDHIAINLRQSGRAPLEVMDELATEVMPLLKKSA
ncbi:TIGR03571 family LLM class oxidoreductase [Agrobacterium tumefaciens]|uniref:TIGR03571 family LLM class oxidoreductase n=1 Tax=Agrobacterium tumefaciens TaxID=358 RepID=UPI001571B291|nr:TIGR03571 family LLM class oxidoreductase [Agrobacterium tumefaciens]NTB99224.1 TIGR03571 family LLM class oxidoreductase [Agrobacterium tumefaciens]NTC47421.1 TIGR03571 family LLM class oxidoreductase [Agrobacterium tumefaciens]